MNKYRMNTRILLLISLLFVLCLDVYSQTTKDIMKIDFKDGTAVEYYVDNVEQITFNSQEIEQPEDEVIELVDLGLSVKWAKWNLGAKSIEEDGDLYAWGELETKKKYISANYTAPTVLWDYHGKDGISGTPWDVATRKIGKGCRIPTKEEYTELVGYCDIELINIDGISYYKFTGKTGNSIYFKRNSNDEFWLSEEFNSYEATKSNVATSDLHDWEYISFVTYKWEGHYIRPVCEIEPEEEPIMKFIHHFRESAQDDDLYIEIDENTMSKYKIGEDSYYTSEVGALIASTSDILSNMKDVDHYNSFRKESTIQFRSGRSDILKDGTVYYAVPYVVIGGVCYWGEEIKFTAGSNLPKYSIGDPYPNVTNPIGVVCEISNGGTHGKIVSLDYDNDIKWDVNGTFAPASYGTSTTNGLSNTNKMLSKTTSPVARWCRNKGDGWYCPARGELAELSDNLSLVNSTLQSLGYSGHEGFYWSSTEYLSDTAYIVCVTTTYYMGYNGGWYGYNAKDVGNRRVCAMKQF